MRVDLGESLSSVSISPDQSLVAVGGRDVFKILSWQHENGWQEKRNMRVAKTKNMASRVTDIQWSGFEQTQHLIATASVNGAVVIWNLDRVGSRSQEIVYNDHTRTVNRLCWQPSDPHILASGSQDGTVRVWDLRAGCKLTLSGSMDSVRDVRFNPFYSYSLACACEDGNIQIWDLRKPSSYEQKITAHQGLVLALDWHPDMRHTLASGGRDRLIKIWDVTQSKLPQHTIQTISSVTRVQWRPSHPNHIASSANLIDFDVHVWNIQFPYIPLSSFKGHRDAALGFKWFGAKGE